MIDPNTPVLVGFSAVEQKLTDLTQAKEAGLLMVDACLNAANDAGNQTLLEQIERIYVPEGMWGYKDAGKLVAERIGCHKATTILAKIGITQQTLMAKACQDIAEGKATTVLVTAAEAKFRSLQAMIQGLEVKDIEQAEILPDEVMQPEAELWLKEETDAGLAMPVGFYAIMESAYRADKGLSIEQNRDELAQLYHDFSQVAANNPHAWKPEVVDAEFIRNESHKNPMLAFPYTKLHNTSWNVDQSCAMIFTSYSNAKALKLDESRFIYLHTSVENNKTLAVAERKDLQRSIGAEIAAKYLLEASNIQADEIDFIDLYSCFPIAVEIYRDAFNFTKDKTLTYTGGMPFAGGPLNNYALQAACRLFELLRENPGKKGLTSAVSGLLNKQAFGLWATKPAAKGFQFIDVSDEVVSTEKALKVIPEYSGTAIIDGYTVLYQKGLPERVVAICSNKEKQRIVGISVNQATIETMLKEEHCHKTVTLKGNKFELSHQQID